MDNGINSRVVIFVLFFFVAFLAGCSGGGHAPIIDGWQRPSVANSYYIVQHGDTLYSIAWGFGKDYRDLAKVNGISAPYHLRIGQRIHIATPTKKSWHREKVTHKKTIRRQSVKKSPTKRVQMRKVRPMVGERNFVFHNWLWPTKGRVIRSFSTKNGGNKGIDISGHYGQSVVSSAPGTVVYCGTGLRAYGRLIIIKHNSDYLSAYAHNRQMLVQEGQVVKAGQKIATMGKDNSGRVVLHFEIRRSGKPVNPLRYL